MDRELLLEIGCEELPASWLPGLTNQIGEAVIAQLRAQRLAPEAPAETFSTPRRLTVRIARIPGTTDRSRGAGQRSAGVRGLQTRRHADARRERIRVEAGCRGVSARAHSDAERGISRLPETAARQDVRRCAAGGAGRDAAGIGVPESDALGCDARRRPGRAAVRASDPLDFVFVRRPRGAVHDFPNLGCPDVPGAGRDDRRSHLRPSVLDDQRPGGPVDQGAQLRRVPGAAAREFRRAGAQRTARQDRARARRKGAAAAGPGQPIRAQRHGPAVPGARPCRVPRGRGRHVRARVSRAARTRC